MGARRVILALACGLLLAGCGRSVNLERSYSLPPTDGRVEIIIQLRDKDLTGIYARQIYYFAYLGECDGRGEFYPGTPLINGSMVREFRLPTRMPLTLSIDAPQAFYGELEKPCLYLKGQSYFGISNLRSNTVPVEHERF